MIKVEGLVKKFGKKDVLKDISFNIEQGEIVGFLGPNGAGKTTTIRVLTSYLPPTSGKVIVADHDMFYQSDLARKKIGYLPENVPLYTDMSVRYYLSFMGKLKGLKGNELKDAVKKVIESCQLEENKDQLIRRLSKGYRQRVGLAQALIHTPEVLILDEPTIGLDPNQIKKTRELIKSNAGSKTVLLSTHILPEVSQICDRVLIIDRGVILASDKPENLVNKLKSVEGIFLKLRATKEITSILKSLEGVLDLKIIKEDGVYFDIHLDTQLGLDLRERIAKVVIENGCGLLELRKETPDLEDVYHRITMEEVN